MPVAEFGELGDLFAKEILTH